jgi:hypothetical protein
VNPEARSRLIEQARLDIATIHAYCESALANLANATGGYPATTPGAGPATLTAEDLDRTPDPNGDIHLTPVEAAVIRTDPNGHVHIGNHDRNRQAITWIDEDLTKMAHHAANAASRIQANCTAGTPEGREADARARRLHERECTNHARYDIYDIPRGDDTGTLCRWCHDVRKPLKRGGLGALPDLELIQARIARGIPTAVDYERFRRRIRAQSADERAERRTKRKATA